MLLAAMCLVSGSALLPTNAPTVHSISQSAHGNENTIGFKIVDIDAQIAANPPSRNEIGLLQLGAMSSTPVPARTDQIRKGDVLNIAAQVRDDGSITVPYVGTLRADDTYPDVLAERIRQRLKPLSQIPFSAEKVSSAEAIARARCFSPWSITST